MSVAKMLLGPITLLIGATIASATPQICGWQWEGIHSRWECHDNPSALSHLSVEETHPVRIINASSHSATFSISCLPGSGSSQWTQLEESEDRTYLCKKNSATVRYSYFLPTGGEAQYKSATAYVNKCYVFTVYRDDAGRHQNLKEQSCNSRNPFAGFIADSISTNVMLENRTSYKVYYQTICAGDGQWKQLEQAPKTTSNHNCPAGRRLEISYKKSWLAGCANVDDRLTLVTGRYDFSETGCGMNLNFDQ